MQRSPPCQHENCVHKTRWSRRSPHDMFWTVTQIKRYLSIAIAAAARVCFAFMADLPTFMADLIRIYRCGIFKGMSDPPVI